jgi:glycosyltransferase involved in cell wall biosynthesis
VSFEVGGVPDVVRHDETGYLARLGDAEALAEGIKVLLADDERRRRLAEACRALAEAEFGAELEAQRFADLYDEVTRTFAARRADVAAAAG